MTAWLQSQSSVSSDCVAVYMSSAESPESRSLPEMTSSPGAKNILGKHRSSTDYAVNIFRYISLPIATHIVRIDHLWGITVGFLKNTEITSDTELTRRGAWKYGDLRVHTEMWHVWQPHTFVLYKISNQLIMNCKLSLLWQVIRICVVHSNGLGQERCNSSALAMELHLSCINPWI